MHIPETLGISRVQYCLMNTKGSIAACLLSTKKHLWEDNDVLAEVQYDFLPFGAE
jgi:hypothetical protein